MGSFGTPEICAIVVFVSVFGAVIQFLYLEYAFLLYLQMKRETTGAASVADLASSLGS